MKYLLLTVLLLILGCPANTTQQYPTDSNQVANVLAIDRGEALILAEVSRLAKIAFIERLCILGLIGGVGGIIVLVWLKLEKLAFIAVALIAGSLTGISFIEMNSHYPKVLPVAGGVVLLIFGGIAVYYVIKNLHLKTALTDVVKNVEVIKGSMVEEPSRTALMGVLDRQSEVTKALVAKIRAKL